MADEKKLYPLMVHASERRERMRDTLMESIEKDFPMKGKHYSLELESFHINRKIYSNNEQKDAILNKTTLTEPIKGTVALRDNATGEVLERSTRTLVHMPYMTERHTFMLGGNEYAVSNQVRIKPGVYTRKRGNGELESAFNLGAGTNFRLEMDPERGLIFMKYKSTQIPLYPVLRALDVTAAQIEKAWGDALAKHNYNYASGKEAASIDKLYKKIISPYAQDENATYAQKVEEIKESYKRTSLDRGVTTTTLGTGFDKVEPKTLLLASRKLVRVYNNKEEVDDRDSAAFKTLHTAESFMGERIRKETSKQVRSKIMRKLNKPTTDIKLSKVMTSGPYSKSLKSWLTSTALANTPMQINPMEVIDSSVKITSLGDGGISSTLAVPDAARDVHSSQIGLLDPVRTPESGKAGIDIRGTLHLARDNDGNMYTPLIDAKTRKAKFVQAADVVNARVAFHGQEARIKANKSVDILHKGVVQSAKGADVDYYIPYAASMYSPTTNLIPMTDSAAGNRNIMGAKFQTQALPLVEREVPWVQVASWRKGKTVEQEFGMQIAPTTPVSGVVEKIDDDYVYIRKDRTKTAAPTTRVLAKGQVARNEEDDDIIRVPYSKDFPLMSKTYLDDTITAKVGDKVSAGDALGESNFTKGDTLALGKNMRVGYMAYKGLNSNDAVVISEGASKKLRSTHMYKESLSIDPSTVLDKNKHKAYFGTRYSAEEYGRLADNGVIKKGQIVQEGEILIAALRVAQASAHEQMLGKLHKSLMKPYRDGSVTWEHHAPGEVIDVAVTKRNVLITVKCVEGVRIGDKLANRFGAKGVVSTIVPDSQMIQDEEGRPLDVLLTSAGIISRVNPSQILETALAKVAEKTGKPIAMEQQGSADNVILAETLLKKHGLKAKETVYDPITKRKIHNIMVGPQYTFKMFKSTDTNFAGRGIGPGYDANMQPSKGGDMGAKSVGKMEFNALISHNARNMLREVSSVKSQRNDEYWRRLQLGLPTKQPGSNFAYDKFTALLQGSGVGMRKEGSKIKLVPLTDRDIDALAPKAVANSLLVKTQTGKGAAHIEPEKGGLFDFAVTGGLQGTKYSKIELAEPVVNPVFVEPARKLLNMTRKDFESLRDAAGAGEIKNRLNKIDLAKEERELLAKVKVTRGNARDNLVKKVKYIRALRSEKLQAGDAYVLTRIPVTPPVMRPLIPNADGTTLVADSNYLYRDLMMANEAIVDTPKELRDALGMGEQRKHLHDTVGALFGTQDSTDAQNRGRGVTGHLSQITGQGSPKNGYFQSRLMKRRQDLTGRATIAPGPTLGMDEVGIPNEMAWRMYEPFIVKRLIGNGMRAVDAKNAWKKRTPAAKRALDMETKKRPVVINRAPTLHRFNMIAAYPKLLPGKTMRINPFSESGLNADFDGDALQVHVPIEDAAIKEAEGMTLSNLVFGDRSKDDLMVFPAHEAIIGNYMATANTDSSPTKTYKTVADARAAYNRNEVNMSTKVNILELNK